MSFESVPKIDSETLQIDYIQWSIDHSYRNNDPSERTTDVISRRLNVMGFAAIQSSAITLVNLILDMGACPRIEEYLSIMRSQILTELSIESGVWSKAALDRMTTLDSTLRESMRLWGFVSRGVLKEVVKKEGVTLPTGEHLPQGTKVGLHAYPVHHDEDIYPNSYAFDPLRFCKSIKADDNGLENASYRSRNKTVNLVTTSSTFMAFSHGRHAW